MIDLTATYMGIPLKNPLIVGSGTTTETPEICEKAAKNGWGGIVLKTLFAQELQEQSNMKFARPMYKLLDARGLRKWKPPVPRVPKSHEREGRRIGKPPTDYVLALGYSRQFYDVPREYQVGSMVMFLTPETYLEYANEAARLCKPYDCKVFASIAAFSEKGWVELCEMVNRSAVDGVELNLGCPTSGSFDPETGKFRRGIAIGTDPAATEAAASIVMKTIKNMPVSIKLPTNCADPVGVAKAIQKSGAQGIQFADTPVFQPPVHQLLIDPDTLEVGTFPGLPFSYLVTTPSVVPFICGVMANFRLAGIDIDLSGCGGVRESRDAILILMAGATSVQVCSATMVEGLEIGNEYIEEIATWMQGHGYESIRQIQGIVATKEKLTSDVTKMNPPEVPQRVGGPTPRVQVVLDERRCINCGWCEACPCLAIHYEDKHPIIDQKRCEVCGICVAVCPMEALSIQPRSQ